MPNNKLRRRLEAMRQRAAEVRANSTGQARDVAAGFADGLQAALDAINATAEAEPNGERWVVLVGNPVKGVSIHGPFRVFADACAWGDMHAPHSEFWVAPLVRHMSEPGPRLAVDNDTPQ